MQVYLHIYNTYRTNTTLLIICERIGKKIIARTLCFMHQSFFRDIGNVCSFLNLNIHTNEWNTTIRVCASLRLIFSRRCSNAACLLVKIWYVCVCDCKSCSALKKVKTGRIYTYVYALLTLVLSNNYILKLFSSQR